MSHRKLLQLAVSLGLVLLVAVACSIRQRTSDDGTVGLLVGFVKIQIPCTDPLLVQSEEEAEDDQPYLSSTPLCGVPSQQGGSPGTTLTVTGYGFVPNTETEIWWEDHRGNEFRQRQAGEYVEVITDQNGEFQIDIVIPYQIVPSNNSEEVMVWVLKARQGEDDERSPSLDMSRIVEHGIISSTGWFLGVIAGGGLGYGLALVIRRLFAAKPVLRKLAIWLPWRTMLMTLILPLWFPVVIVIHMGIGPETDVVSVGLTTFLLALALSISVLLRHWHPTPVAAYVIAWARTLATASVVFEFFVGVFGGGGVGLAVIQYIRLLDYETGLRYCASLIFIMLLLDLLIGGIQYTVAMRVKGQSPAVALE